MKISLSVDWIFKGKKENHFPFVWCSSCLCGVVRCAFPFIYPSKNRHIWHYYDGSFPSCNMSHDLLLLPCSWWLWIVCNHDTSKARRGWRCDSRAICSYTNFFFLLVTKCTKGHNRAGRNRGKLCRIAGVENVLDFILWQPTTSTTKALCGWKLKIYWHITQQIIARLFSLLYCDNFLSRCCHYLWYFTFRILFGIFKASFCVEEKQNI